MYSYIIGKLTEKNGSTIVVEANGIGYEILASQTTAENVGNIGDNVKIFTYLHVREDEMSLYGFSSLAEKQMFLNLTSISGIGPKMSIGILSNIKLGDLALAIVSNDASLLYKVKGVGKKTADRIVLELNEKLENLEQYQISNESQKVAEMDDAILGLTALGMNRIDAVKLVREFAENGDSAEEIIAKCLRGRK